MNIKKLAVDAAIQASAPTPPDTATDAGRLGKVVAIATVPGYRIEWAAPDYGCQLTAGTHNLVLASDLDAVTAERDALRQSVVAGAANTRQVADALKALCFAARISGGVAGRDEGLVAACEKAEHALSLLGVGQAVNAAIDVLDQLAASQKECERLREEVERLKRKAAPQLEAGSPERTAELLRNEAAALATGGRHESK